MAPPTRKGIEWNKQVRPGGEHLTPKDVERLAKAASKIGRHGFRDGHLIRICFRHGLRVGELVGLLRAQVDLNAGDMQMRRLKKGKDTSHGIGGDETRALRRLYRDYPDSAYVFCSERKGPLTTSAVQKIVARAGRAAGFEVPIHPHMLRHSCGFKLANEGKDLRAIMDYLGHRTLAMTVKYTELSTSRFKNFWKD